MATITDSEKIPCPIPATAGYTLQVALEESFAGRIDFTCVDKRCKVFTISTGRLPTPSELASSVGVYYEGLGYSRSNTKETLRGGRIFLISKTDQPDNQLVTVIATGNPYEFCISVN